MYRHGGWTLNMEPFSKYSCLPLSIPTRGLAGAYVQQACVLSTCWLLMWQNLRGFTASEPGSGVSLGGGHFYFFIACQEVVILTPTLVHVMRFIAANQGACCGCQEQKVPYGEESRQGPTTSPIYFSCLLMDAPAACLRSRVIIPANLFLSDMHIYKYTSTIWKVLGWEGRGGVGGGTISEGRCMEEEGENIQREKLQSQGTGEMSLSLSLFLSPSCNRR